MFRLLTVFLSALFLVSAFDMPTFAKRSRVDLGFNMGFWQPLDNKVRETFSNDFYYRGHLGLYDPDSHWEIRGTLGRFRDTSHHTDDIGKDFDLSLLPLLGSVLYHTGTPRSTLSPYFGGGAGVYFYNFSDNVVDTLESGSKFGFHGVAGVRLHLTNAMYLNLEYTHHFISKTFFNNADHFNQNSLTFGLGFLLDTVLPETPKQPKKKAGDPLKRQIHALDEEIILMKAKRKELREKVDVFYTQSDYYFSTDFFSAVNDDKELVGGQLSIINPDTQKTLIEGSIHAITVNEDGAYVITLKHDQWRSEVVVDERPFSVTISGERQSSISPLNADKALLVNGVYNSEEFATALRQIRYYEESIDDLDKRISEAQVTFRDLSAQLEKRQETIGHSSDVHTHIDIDYRHGRRWHGRRYRYYDPVRYRYHPPAKRSSKPSASSIEEREAYIKKKRDYINKVKNR